MISATHFKKIFSIIDIAVCLLFIATILFGYFFPETTYPTNDALGNFLLLLTIMSWSLVWILASNLVYIINSIATKGFDSFSRIRLSLVQYMFALILAYLTVPKFFDLKFQTLFGIALPYLLLLIPIVQISIPIIFLIKSK